MYDIKLAEYAQPICVDNLEVDTQYFQEQFHSDLIFNEEKKSVENQGSNSADTEEYKSPSDAENGGQIENKEYVEINFQFNYTGDEESPIKLSLENDSPQIVDTRKTELKNKPDIDIYDTSNVIYIEPMFMIDVSTYHNFTLKLSLEKLIEKQKNMCRQAICLLNRTNNK